MPIYEYECEECGGKFEIRRGMTDSDIDIACPKCGAKKPRRVFSVFATHASSGSCNPSSPTWSVSLWGRLPHLNCLKVGVLLGWDGWCSEFKIKRGQIESIEAHGEMCTIHSFIPLAETFGYTTNLRSLTQGRPTHSMEFYRYQVLPEDLVSEVRAVGRR